MSRLSRFRFLRFSADGITFGDSSPVSVSDSKTYNLKIFNNLTDIFAYMYIHVLFPASINQFV